MSQSITSSHARKFVTMGKQSNQIIDKNQDEPSKYMIAAGAPEGQPAWCVPNFAAWCKEFHSQHVTEGQLQPYNPSSDVRMYLALSQTGAQNETEVSLWDDYDKRTNLTDHAAATFPKMIGSELSLLNNQSCIQTTPIPQFNNNYSFEMFISHSTRATCNDFSSFTEGAVDAYPALAPLPPVAPSSNFENGTSLGSSFFWGSAAAFSTVVLGAVAYSFRVPLNKFRIFKLGWATPSTAQKNEGLCQKFEKIHAKLLALDAHVSDKISKRTNASALTETATASTSLLQQNSLQLAMDVHQKTQFKSLCREAKKIIEELTQLAAVAYKPEEDAQSRALILSTTKECKQKLTILTKKYAYLDIDSLVGAPNDEQKESV